MGLWITLAVGALVILALAVLAMSSTKQNAEAEYGGGHTGHAEPAAPGATEDAPPPDAGGHLGAETKPEHLKTSSPSSVESHWSSQGPKDSYRRVHSPCGRRNVQHTKRVVVY